jgi:hypothetical protein
VVRFADDPAHVVTEDIAGYLADAVDFPCMEGQRSTSGRTGR